MQPLVQEVKKAKTKGKKLFSVSAVFLVGAVAFNIFLPVPGFTEPSSLEQIHRDPLVGLPEVEKAPLAVKKTYLSQITVYNSTPEQTDGDPFTMANGNRVHDGAVAANCLPFGTQLRMPDLFGDKIFTVEDRLAPRKSCFIIDIWQEVSANAKSFGAPVTRIEILGPSPSPMFEELHNVVAVAQ